MNVVFLVIVLSVGHDPLFEFQSLQNNKICLYRSGFTNIGQSRERDNSPHLSDLCLNINCTFNLTTISRCRRTVEMTYCSADTPQMQFIIRITHETTDKSLGEVPFYSRTGNFYSLCLYGSHFD